MKFRRKTEAFLAPATISSRSGGFTLVELVMTMVVVGILAAVVLPKMVDQQAFNARGFYDETLALLHYAQKTAIAQRRTVCVAFTPTGATLTVASAEYASSCDTNLTGTKGDTPATITAKPGVTYSPKPSDFSFNALGQPSATQPVQVSGAGSIISIEAETGYVR